MRRNCTGWRCCSVRFARCMNRNTKYTVQLGAAVVQLPSSRLNGFWLNCTDQLWAATNSPSVSPVGSPCFIRSRPELSTHNR